MSNKTVNNQITHGRKDFFEIPSIYKIGSED